MPMPRMENMPDPPPKPKRSATDAIKELTIEVPIKPFLKRYLSKHYQINPFRMSRHGLISEHMWLLFAQEYTEWDGSHSKFTESLKVVVPHLFMRQNRLYFDLPTIRRLNGFIEEHFWLECNTFLEGRVDLMEIKDAIQAFQDKYDLDEEVLQFETIKKRFYRYRKGPLKNGQQHSKENQ